jgi:hypothetical protein
MVNSLARPKIPTMVSEMQLPDYCGAGAAVEDAAAKRTLSGLPSPAHQGSASMYKATYSAMCSGLLVVASLACAASTRAPASAGGPSIENAAVGGRWRTVNRSLKAVTAAGRSALELEARPMVPQVKGVGGEGLVYDPSVSLTEGDIELDMLADGDFVGVAFQIRDEHTYDAVYFRPANFASPDSGPRSRAIQYVAHPQYSWSTLRRDSPGAYEDPINVPIRPGDWFHVRVQLASGRVRVYLNRSAEPAMDVADLGPPGAGSAGAWVGNGSGGTVANLVVRPGR